jgi:cyclophilin family peptidyl-prolyl cis-trans isomerase
MRLAEDADAFDALLKAAATDQDSRVRVSAIRSLAALKNAKAADKLLERAETLLDARTKSKSANPNEKSELLEIATTLGRILPNSNDERAIRFLQSFRESDKYRSPETEIAFARVSPKLYLSSNSLSKINYDAVKNKINADWRAVGSIAQGLGEIANLEATEETRKLREQSAAALLLIIENPFEMKDYETAFSLAMPDVLRAYAQFKSDNLAEVLRAQMKAKDAIVRATAVELLAGLPPEQTRFGDFEDSFRIALEDEKLDDALLATIEAIGKQKIERAADFLKDRLYYLAKLNPKYGSSKYLARRRIIALLKEKGTGDFSDQLGKTDSIFAQNDYVRAVTRKTPSAILKTEKGTFTIEFFPKEAPLTVDNFIKLANAKYFDGLTIHRVVPNFVMQDGDPRGDGNGGPGWQIRDEINMLPYERGAVGMALSGKDTGGSQWFVTHAPQPHLDGGYTVFGQVNETGMKVVDSLTRGDKILSVKIVEGKLTPKSGKR